jgi:L-iditol 2-dehydrogenase
MVRVTRHRGRLAFIGQGGSLDIAPLVGKGLRLYGCWHWNHLQQSERMLATIAGSAERINKMITHTFPLSGIAEAFALQNAGECGKIVLHPWED